IMPPSPERHVVSGRAELTHADKGDPAARRSSCSRWLRANPPALAGYALKFLHSRAAGACAVRYCYECYPRDDDHRGRMTGTPAARAAQLEGAAAALAAAALFGVSAPLAKMLLPGTGPLPLAAFLYLGAGLGLASVGALAR